MVFKQSIAYSLPQQEALSRIKDLFIRLRHEQKDKLSNVKENWQHGTCAFQFTALGFTVSGSLTIHSSTIELNAKLPYAVFPFRNKIKQVIRDKAKELLAA